MWYCANAVQYTHCTWSEHTLSFLRGTREHTSQTLFVFLMVFVCLPTFEFTAQPHGFMVGGDNLTSLQNALRMRSSKPSLNSVALGDAPLAGGISRPYTTRSTSTGLLTRSRGLWHLPRSFGSFCSSCRGPYRPTRSRGSSGSLSCSRRCQQRFFHRRCTCSACGVARRWCLRARHRWWIVTRGITSRLRRWPSLPSGRLLSTCLSSKRLIPVETIWLRAQRRRCHHGLPPHRGHLPSPPVEAQSSATRGGAREAIGALSMALRRKRR